MTRGWAAWLLALGITTHFFGAVWAQNYPTRPIRIFTGTAGGSLDLAVRLMGPGLSGNLGLLFGTPLWIGPILQKLSYDPVRDFAPITLAASTPNILVVHPSVPAQSVKELIALAKSKPGLLNYAAGSIGAISHLAGELFKYMAGINIARISYQGTGPADIALLGGEVQLMFSVQPAVAPHIKSGKLRALAVTSARPSALLPDLPTVAASGLPGYECVLLYGTFTPARTPETVINRLNREMVRVLNQGNVREKFFNSGAEVVGSTPEQFALAIQSDTAKMSEMIAFAGIRIE